MCDCTGQKNASLSFYVKIEKILFYLISPGMSFFRSDEVSYFRLVIPRQSAWDIMNRLGQQQLLHICPAETTVLTRPFLSHVRRCEDALYRLTSLQKYLDDKEIYKHKDAFSDAAYHQIFRLWEDQYAKASGHPASVLNDMIGEVDHAWGYYEDLTKRAEVLGSKLQAFRDNSAVLKAGQGQFGRQFFTVRGRAQQMGSRYVEGSKINYKCGVIDLQEQIRFKKTVFRITKGNALIHCVPFNQLFQNLLPEEQRRVVFYILYPGGGADSYLDRKLTKLVQNFCDGVYELPTTEQQFLHINKNLFNSINETTSLLNLTQTQLNDFLQRLSEPLADSEYFRRHEYLKLYIIKEKDVYVTLNQMELYSNFMQGKVYVRNCDVQTFQRTLVELEDTTKHAVGQLVPASTERYPTHFVTNSFTASAQEIVETYGVANYQEANPGFFTVVTFPFLFGVMFGDIGHGSILFAFGCYLVFGVREDTQNMVYKMIRPHRYILTLMGFFSIYCGLIYNDFLSISLDLFGSCFDVSGVAEGGPIPRYGECIYPVGIDPVWAVAENNLVFINSLKMKISVIIAVVHMTLGVFVKASNNLYFCNLVDFFFEFVPQLIFLTLLFGYMDFLIVYKWTVNWGLYAADAPSVITTMINLPLKLGKTQDCCGGQPMWGQMGGSQDQIQLLFLLVALICIPWMLIPKPLILIYCGGGGHHKVKEEEDERLNPGKLLSGSLDEGSEPVLSSSIADKKDDEHSPSQIFVHQLIETIEYVLGCISNTASYLRLWALSLAHSQLSEVFFDKLVKGSIASGFAGIPMMLIGFVFLAGITFGVLLCMDSMECFLHTLRLHWVEFNNKFYKGSGFLFEFYSFRKRVSQEVATDL